MVVVGCGRVGSGLAVGLAQQGHSVAIMDKAARSFRRLPGGWPGTTVVGSGFDRDDLDRAGAEHGRRPGRRDQRRQLQHPDGPHRPRELRHPQRGGPHLRPPAGRDLPAPGHPHRGHGDVDHRPGPAPAAARSRSTGEWTDATGQLVLVEHVLPEAWAGKRLYDLGWPGRQPGGRDPGRRAPTRRRRHGRPGGRRPARGGDEGRHGRPRAPDRQRRRPMPRRRDAVEGRGTR